MEDKKYDQIIISLKIISQIQRNGKVRRVKDGHITLEDIGVFISFKRLFLGDGRIQTVSDLSSIFNDAFLILKSLLASEFIHQRHGSSATDQDREIYDKITTLYENLNKSVIGLENLKNTTYKTDVIIVASLEEMIRKIKVQTSEVLRKMPQNELLSLTN